MGGCDSRTCVPYSGFTSRDKYFVNFVDLLLCVKILLTNTSCIAYKVWLKIQSANLYCEMLMHAQVCVCSVCVCMCLCVCVCVCVCVRVCVAIPFRGGNEYVPDMYDGQTRTKVFLPLMMVA